MRHTQVASGDEITCVAAVSALELFQSACWGWSSFTFYFFARWLAQINSCFFASIFHLSAFFFFFLSACLHPKLYSPTPADILLFWGFGVATTLFSTRLHRAGWDLIWIFRCDWLLWTGQVCLCSHSEVWSRQINHISHGSVLQWVLLIVWYSGVMHYTK